jgi:predicted membrane metal-binding protein
MSKVATGPSERSFGVTFGAVFILIGVLPWIFHNRPFRLWALVLAGLFAGAALFAPKVLYPLNRVWLQLGIAMHRIGNPVVMGVIYFVGFVPMGLAIKARGKDLLRLRWEPDAPSYWIRRQPPGPTPASMSKQF